MTATATVLAPGDQFGGYRIIEVIGIGGMAVVYRAEQLSLGREVALKVLTPAIADDPGFRDRFRREGRHVAALEHPNIVTVHDFGEVDGQLYLAMRLVRGMTLADRTRGAGLTAEQAVELLAPIADALEAASAAGVVHRDVKPQNILIDHRGRPYLADFGVAKGTTTAGSSATAGFVGTYNYAAPEQILGQPVTPAADVYGLAAVLFQCFTGQRPFAHDEPVLYAQVNGQRPTVDPRQPGGEHFNRLIERGMAIAPRDRFESAGAMMRETADLVAGLPASRRQASPPFEASLARRPGDTQPAAAIAGVAPAVGRTAGRRRRSLWLAVGAIAAAVVVIVGAALALTSGSSPAVRKSQVSTARASPLTIRYSRPWRSVPVTGANQIQLVDGDATLTGVASSAAVPGDVPPALAHGYGRPIRSENAVVAGHRGRSYTWAPAGEAVVAYVLGLATGDSAIVCRGPAGAGAALRSCGLLAQRASVPSAVVLPPGPDRQLADAIRGPLKPVLAARSALNGLGGPTLQGRAARASKVAKAERAAAVRLVRLAPPERYQPAVTRLAKALKREAGAFASLARAAHANDRTTYGLAAAAVVAASHNLASVTGALAPYQLPVAHLGVLRLDRAPPVPVVGITSSTTGSSPSSSPTLSFSYTATNSTSTTTGVGS